MVKCYSEWCEKCGCPLDICCKEEGRKQGVKDLLKEIKCIYKGFVDVREADEYVLDFIKRQIKKELKV